MIALGVEPEGLLIRRADVFAWLPGLSVKEWARVREHLEPVPLPGCEKPYYRREEVRAKLVDPILRAARPCVSTQQPTEATIR